MSARPQTAMAAALQRAGMNTAKTRLYQLAVDALRKGRNAPDRGFSVFERGAEDDPDLVREALAEYYQRRDAEMSGVGHNEAGIHSDPAGARQPNGDGGSAASSASGAGLPNGVNRGVIARPVREPSPEDRAASARVAQSIAITVFDRVKTSDGRPWGNVGAHELDGMDRDGAVARIVKNKLGVLSNAQRFQTLRELMRPDLFEEAIAQARGETDATR